MTNYRELGRTGVRISPFALGTANFGEATDEHEARNIIAAAIESGINLIDTADVYAGGESERIVGHALKDMGLRDRVVLATKVHYPTGDGPNDKGNSRLHIMQAVEKSLQRLQTDHIDLYQLHRPDFGIPQEETIRALDDLVSKGKVRYIGTSTAPSWFIMEALAVSDRYGLVKPITEQAPYSLVERRAENEVIPLCQRYNIGVLAWSPLAGGILAGRYPLDEEIPEESRLSRGIDYYNERVTLTARKMASKVSNIAAQAKLTSAQLAVLWVKEQPGITAAIIGPRTLDHLESMLEIMNRPLADDLASELDKVSHSGTAVADFYNTSGWMKEHIPASHGATGKCRTSGLDQ